MNTITTDTKVDHLIIGSGVSGLSLGTFLKKYQKKVLIIDEKATTGGQINTLVDQGFQIETAANTIITNDSVNELIDYLDIQNNIIQPNIAAKKRYVYTQQKLCQLPSSPPSLLKSDLMPFKDKLMIVRELFHSSNNFDDNWTIKQFFEQHFGKFITENLVDAFISGVWAGDISKLSFSETFPEMAILAKQYGSLLKGFIKKPPKSQKVINFKKGLGFLMETMTQKLTVQLNAQSILQEYYPHNEYPFKVEINSQSYWVKKIILAIPVHNLLSFLHPIISPIQKQKLNTLTEQVRYAPIKVVNQGFHQLDSKEKTEGFGFLVPRTEQKNILGTIFNHQVFANRVPSEDYQLLSTFIGGAHYPEILQLDNTQTSEIVLNELQQILGFQQRPCWETIITWEKGIPQYEVGHSHAVNDFINELELPDVHFCTNWKDGTAVGRIIEKSQQLAKQLADV